MEIIFYAGYIAIAFFSAVLLSFGFIGSMQVSGQLRDKSITLIIILLGIGLIASNLLSGRNLTYVGLSIEELYTEQSGFAGIFDKLLNWVIAGFALAGCLERIWVRYSKKNTIFPRGWWLIMILAYTLTNGFTGSLFGTHPGFKPGLLYPALVLVFLAIDDRWQIDSVLSISRNLLFWALLVGLILLPIKPGLVLEQNVTGYIPFVHFRFWGVASHANAIGSVAVTFLLIRYLKPFRISWLNWFSIFAAVGTLILSQSKTSILGGLVAYVVILMYQLFQAYHYKRSLLQWSIIDVAKLVVCIALIGIPILLSIFGVDPSHSLNSKFAQSVETLSGRTQIWEVAINEWKSSPIFGYGPSIFDEEYRMRMGMNFLYHAHNQFIQTLAESGAVGAFGLIIFLTKCAAESIKAAKATKGASIAILVFILVRCLTEVPLRSGAMLSGEYILLLLWVAILMAYAPAPENKNKCHI